MFESIGIAFLMTFAIAMAVGYTINTYRLRRDRLIRTLGDDIADEEEFSEEVLRNSGALLTKARRFLECSPLEGVMDVVDEIDTYLLAYEEEGADNPARGFACDPNRCESCSGCEDEEAQ